MIFILISIIALWLSAWILVDAHNKMVRKNSTWKLSNKFPDKRMRGALVKISQEMTKQIEVRTIESVDLNNDYLLESGSIKAIQQYDNSYSYGFVRQNTMGKISYQVPLDKFEKYIKLVKPLQEVKGGEKKVNKMPRLWRLLIIYVPLAILVWDIVLNANSITSFVVTHFVLVHK